MMSKKILNLSFLILTLTGINASAAETSSGPKLGRAASAEEIAAWEISVMPDGRGLPAGQGSAVEAEKVYMDKCLSCHGPKGEGASADQLAFAKMALTDEWPEKTIGSYWPYATTLFDFNRRSMPMQAPGSMSDNETYAVTAYLLYLNGIIGETEVMNAKSLAKVRMPNRSGFINVYDLEKNR
jgi:mono/diheme cytochrome c family protein